MSSSPLSTSLALLILALLACITDLEPTAGILSSPAWSWSWSWSRICKSGFPSGSVVKNLPSNAGDMGSMTSPGRSHMLRSNKVHVPQLLSPCSRARESQLLSLCSRARESQLLSLRAAAIKAWVPESLCSRARESQLLSPHAAAIKAWVPESLCSRARESQLLSPCSRALESQLLSPRAAAIKAWAP